MSVLVDEAAVASAARYMAHEDRFFAIAQTLQDKGWEAEAEHFRDYAEMLHRASTNELVDPPIVAPCGDMDHDPVLEPSGVRCARCRVRLTRG